MTSGRPVDQQARYIAGVSSLIAGSAAAFWIVQLIRGAKSRDDLFLVVNICFFAAIAFMFARITKAGGKIGVMPMLLFLVNALRFIHGPLAKQDRVAGVVTFVAAVAIAVADLALQYRQRRAAQHRVAADRAAPGR